MLDFNNYRDNNNFVRINDVEVKDNRWQFMELSPDEYRYVDLIINQPWVGPSANWTREISLDNGKTF